jgi:hypothetical protein
MKFKAEPTRQAPESRQRISVELIMSLCQLYGVLFEYHLFQELAKLEQVRALELPPELFVWACRPKYCGATGSGPPWKRPMSCVGMRRRCGWRYSQRSATCAAANGPIGGTRNRPNGRYRSCRRSVSAPRILMLSFYLWNTTYLPRAVDHLRKQGHHPAPGDVSQW